MLDPRRLAIELDEHLASRPIPATVHQRLRARLLDGRARPTNRSLVLIAAVALLGSVLGSLLALVVGPTASDSEPVAAKTDSPASVDAKVEPAPTWNELDPTCTTHSVDGTVELVGRCDVALMSPSLTLHSFGFARVRPTPRGVAVLDGWIAFDVEPVSSGHPPVVVHVPGGSIEVVGTRFSVWTDGRQGHVDLIEGKVRFRSQGGTQLLHPGERAQWTTSETSDAEVAEPPRPPPPAASPIDAEQLAADLREVARLRGRGRHREALTIIDRWMKRVSEREVLETLSFERGTLLETTTDRSEVCRHWNAHERDFGAGRYAESVEQRIRRFRCR